MSIPISENPCVIQVKIFDLVTSVQLKMYRIEYSD